MKELEWLESESSSSNAQEQAKLLEFYQRERSKTTAKGPSPKKAPSTPCKSLPKDGQVESKPESFVEKTTITN